MVALEKRGTLDAMSDIGKAVRLLERGQWQAAHELVQDDDSPLGCWAHGIVHLMEGDLANARYWYGRAGRDLQDPADTGGEIARLRARAAGRA